jgi:hypothetical protein
MFNETKMGENLLGKRVVGLAVSEHERALRFTVEDGPDVYWDTEGDCCSQSWWADGFNLGQLIGGVVSGVEELETVNLGAGDDRSRDEFDEVYGYEITTDRGKAKLAFRNSSNGYYGGWASEDTSAPPVSEWHEITTSDWQA